MLAFLAISWSTWVTPRGYWFDPKPNYAGMKLPHSYLLNTYNSRITNCKRATHNWAFEGTEMVAVSSLQCSLLAFHQIDQVRGTIYKWSSSSWTTALSIFANRCSMCWRFSSILVRHSVKVSLIASTLCITWWKISIRVVVNCCWCLYRERLTPLD